MSYPSSKNLTEYGTQISKGVYARKLYNDESAGLTITTDSSEAQHIDILCGSITLGKAASTKNIIIREGTLTSQFLNSKTFSDTVASLSGGTMSGLLFEQLAVASVTGILYGTSITDNTAMMHAGSVTGVVYSKANTFTDGTTLLVSGSITNVSSMGIGVTDPDAKLEVLSSTTQQKWSYDSNSYLTMTVADNSNSTLATAENGTLTLNSAGDMILKSDGGNVIYKYGSDQFLKIKNSASNAIIYNGAADKDIIFKDFGTDSEIMRIDGSAESLLIATNKKIEFSDSQDYITSDGTNLSVVSGGALSYTASAASTWAINGGDLTVDCSGDIILDADDSDVMLKDNGTQYMKFTNSAGDGIIYNGAADKDIIFKDLGSDNEIMRVDGSAESLLMATGKKIEFANNTHHISSNGTDLSIVSAGALSYTAGLSSTWAVVGNLTMDVSGDIVLDAEGNNITMKSGGANVLDFVHSNSGDWSIKNTTADKDILFNVNNGGTYTNVMVVDGSSSNVGIGTTNPTTKLQVVGVTTSSSFTDGSALLRAGSITQLKLVDSQQASITKILNASTISDNVSTLKSGSFTGLVYTQSNTISDGTAVLQNATLSGLRQLTSTILSDGTGSFTSGTLSGLLYLKSNTLTDGAATLTNGTFTGLLKTTSNTFTDGFATLSRGTFTGLLSLSTTTLTDGFATLTRGTLTGLNFLSTAVASVTSNFYCPVLTDGTFTLSNGSMTGLLFTSSNTITDGTLTMHSGSITNVVSIGVGVSDPDAKLEIYSTTTQQKWSYDGASYATMTIADDSNMTLANAENGTLTLDVGGDIVLDADGSNIMMKDNGTQFLKFTNSSGNAIVTNGAEDKDIIVKDLSGDEIMRVDGSARSLLMASGRKVEYGAAEEYISGDTTNLTIASGQHIYMNPLVNVGVGVSDPDSKLEVYSTITQQKWSFDADSYASIYVNQDSNTIFKTGENGSLTLDVVGDIILDADGSNVILKDNGVQFIKFTQVTSGDCIITNGGVDKDILFKDASNVEIMRLDGSAKSLLMGSNKKIEFGDTGEYIVSDTTNLTIASGQHILMSPSSNVGIGVSTPTSKLEVLSTTTQQKWAYDGDSYATLAILDYSNTTLSIGQAGTLTLDVGGDIILDADGSNIMFKDAGTQFLKFTNSSGDAIIYNGAESKDIIVKDISGDEILRIDGSARSLLMTSGRKIEFGAVEEYITGDTTNLTIASGQHILMSPTSNVGIGSISDPDTKLEVFAGTIQQKWSYDSDSFSTMYVNQDSNTTLATGQSGTLTLDAEGDIVLDANGSSVRLEDDSVSFLRFTNAGGNCVVYNGSTDKDIVFKDVGEETIFTINGTRTSLLMNTNKRLEFSTINEYIYGDGSDLYINSGRGLQISAGSSSTWAITGDLRLDVSGDIILDADGDNITMKAGGSYPLDFVHSNSGDWTLKNTNQDKDIIFNINDGSADTEVMRIDGSESNVGIGTTTPSTKLHVVGVTTSSSLTDGAGLIYGGSITGFNIASITDNVFSGTLTGNKLTDGTMTMNAGTLSCSSNSGFIEANIGSFTNLYAHDLFVADDMVINGTTTYVNTSQTSFEDELISLGATDGRSVASISSAKIYCEIDVGNGYTVGAKVLCMQADGTKEILEVSSSSNNEVNLTTQPNASTEFISLISTETTVDGAGVEILAHSGGVARHKTFHYVHASTTMEVKSEGTALDLRVSNTSSVSYFSVYDNSSHKKLLTSDALFINTSNSGTISGGSDKAALYFSKNGGSADTNGDWRMRSSGETTSQTMIIEQYDGSNWQVKWQID